MGKYIGWLVILTMCIWSIASWNWYTCNIKGFCHETNSAAKTQKISIPVVVNGEEVEKECLTYLNENIYPRENRENNNPKEVEKLEIFLNEYQNESLEVDGEYSAIDERAVKRFQKRYSSDILRPYRLVTPTGNVFESTIQKINEIHCLNQ